MTRKAISKKTRFEIFKRDGFTCAYCGCTPPEVVLEVDHILAVANGGDNSPDNLATSCRACNAGKSANSLTAVPQSLKERAAEVAEREEQVKAYAEVMAQAKERIEDDAWTVAELFAKHFNQKNDDGTAWVGKDQFQSIKRFVELMPVHEVIDAMERALARAPYATNRNLFRYFCGICWGRLKRGDGQ